MLLLPTRKSTTPTKTLTVAARSSQLSQCQVKELYGCLTLTHPLLAFDVHLMETQGDEDLTTSLRSLDKTDFFTREIDRGVLEGRFHCGIHSAKDLPDPLPEGLELIAMTRGVDPSDSLVLREGTTLETLPTGARIATSSLRRENTVRSLRADFTFVDIRGPVDSRLAQLDKGEVDGVVIAEAALIRLGLTQRNRLLLPGPTVEHQGQLAVVARRGDTALRELFSCVDTLEGQKRSLYTGLTPSFYEYEGEVYHYPVIRIVPRSLHDAQIQSMLQQFASFTHVIFTSKTAVNLFIQFLKSWGMAPQSLMSKTLVSVGKVTSAYLEHFGLDVALCPCYETAEGLVELLKTQDLSQAHVLLPRSSQGRSTLPDYFQEQEIAFFDCTLYDPEAQHLEPTPPLALFDEIFFTSPSTVHAFLQIYGELPTGKTLRSQGPVSQKALDRAAKQRVRLLAPVATPV